MRDDNNWFSLVCLPQYLSDSQAAIRGQEARFLALILPLSEWVKGYVKQITSPSTAVSSPARTLDLNGRLALPSGKNNSMTQGIGKHTPGFLTARQSCQALCSMLIVPDTLKILSISDLIRRTHIYMR